MNIQIPFKQFDNDQRKFDVIFLNDVFEHVFVLSQLANKLKPNGRIFIDTPKQFWIYPFAKLFSKSLYNKILNGTVSLSHLQIWSRSSFDYVVKESGLQIKKMKEVSEYTMPADFYLKNMKISNPFIKMAAKIFYINSKWLANNKIQCVLVCD